MGKMENDSSSVPCQCQLILYSRFELQVSSLQIEHYKHAT